MTACPIKTLDAHLFICTNKRDKGECCADKGSVELRDEVKRLAKKAGLKGRIRVNAAGCLGHCSEGITTVLYPEGKWLTQLTKDDAPVLLEMLLKIGKP